MQHAIQKPDPEQYPPRVAGQKVSTTLDEETLTLARELAEWRKMSLSAWLARAARRQAFFDDRSRLLGEITKEIPKEAFLRADAYLDSIGVPRPPE
jgi:hypothetical protein